MLTAFRNLRQGKPLW